MAAYCTNEDLLIASNLPMPTGLSKSKFVQDAADEIDMHISGLYATPVIFIGAENQMKYQATILFLKHLNAHLATGRLIMAIDVSGEQTALHAYGVSLVKNALLLLAKIVAREVILEGALPNANDPDESAPSARPYIFQLDAMSGVESFYQLVQSGLVNPHTTTTVLLPAEDDDITFTPDGFPQVGG